MLRDQPPKAFDKWLRAAAATLVRGRLQIYTKVHLTLTARS
jgi:hypothetical protein